MAPFGFHLGKKKSHPTGVATEVIVEEPHSALSAHTLGGDGHIQQVHMISQQPVKKPSRFKTLLRKKQPPVQDTIISLHDRQFLDSDDYVQHHTGSSHAHAYTVSGPHITPAPTEHPLPPGSIIRGYDGNHVIVQEPSTSGTTASTDPRTGAQIRRQGTGHSRRTLDPNDSASNVHMQYQYAQPTGTQIPLQGIVEEQSDIDYERRTTSPVQVVTTSIPGHHVVSGPMVVGVNGSPLDAPTEYTTHEIGRGLHLHHGARRPGERLAPLHVTDAHGRQQNVQEIMLDGSGVQEIPMPADGNVIFIVEEGVTLDVKDPETGEYIPLEEYYARLAARAPPKQPDRYVVVNGDASNIIVEDSDGHILHRGERVKSQFIRDRLERSGSIGSVGTGEYSQHIIDRKGNQIRITHPNPDQELRLYVQDEDGLKPNLDHIIITSPPSHYSNFATPRVVHVPSSRNPSRGPSPVYARPPLSPASSSGTGSTRSTRSKRSSSSPSPRYHQPYSELATSPEASSLAMGNQQPLVFDLNDNAGMPTPNVYMAAIPEGSREMLPQRTGSVKSTRTGQSFVVAATPSKRSMTMPDGQSLRSHRTGGTAAGGEFGAQTPVFVNAAALPSGNISYVAGTPSIKGRSASVSTKSLKSVHMNQTGATDPRTSNAVSFADHAMYINPPLDGSSVAPVSEHTPRSLRAGTPGVALANLPPESQPGTPLVTGVGEMPPMGSVMGTPVMKMPSPDVVPVQMVPLRDNPVPLTKKKKGRRGGGSVLELAPDTTGTGSLLTMTPQQTGGTGAVDLSSPPGTAGFGPIQMTGEPDYFGGGFGELSRGASIRSGQSRLTQQQTGPQAQFTGSQQHFTGSPQGSQRSIAGDRTPVIGRIASPNLSRTGSFHSVGPAGAAPPGAWESPPYQAPLAMPEVPDFGGFQTTPNVVPVQLTGVPEHATGGTIQRQPTGASIPAHMTGGTIPVQRTGGTIPRQMTGGTMPMQMTGNGSIPVQMTGNGSIPPQMTGATIPRQATGLSLQRQATGGTMRSQMTGQQPVSSHVTGGSAVTQNSRKPSLMDRMRMAVGGGGRAPSPPRAPSPIYEPGVPPEFMNDDAGFPDVPGVHESRPGSGDAGWGIPQPLGSPADIAEAQAEQMRAQANVAAAMADAAEAEAEAKKEEEEDNDWARPAKKGGKAAGKKGGGKKGKK